MIFNSLDSNKDKVVDFNDFQKYTSSTDDQIRKGFQLIDVDKDGKLRRSDFVRYLKSHLQLLPTVDDVDSLFKLIDSKNEGYVTFDEFRDFLILMPRMDGSRIKTAFTFMADDIDVTSDGDVTLVSQFLNGFGFFLAGGLAGVVSRTCTAPFDRIKVFLIARTDLTSTVLHSRLEIELEMAKHLVEKRSPIAEQLHQKTIRSPIIQAARTLWKQGGFRAFYVGNGLNVLKVFPESAIKFGSFEATKRFLARCEGKDDTQHLSKVATYFAGGIGGIFSQFAVYPIDTLKFRLQCSNLDSSVKGNALLIKTAKQMLDEGGVRMFYRGIFVGTSGIFPYAALDLGTFSTMKAWLIKRQSKLTNQPIDDVRLPNYMVLGMGAFSGTFGATVVYPINLLRTRLQAQGTFAHPQRYTGLKDVFQQTIAREGYGGLFKGLVPNLAKVAPAVSISYFMYENLKNLFELSSTT